MNRQDLDNLKQWFSSYCGTFSPPNADESQPLAVKQEHTERVFQNIMEIARSLSLDENHSLLAGTIALLHDVGRFPQYRQFQTFRDSVSVNHAALGAKVLIELGVLGRLPKAEQDLIIRAVTLHNVFALPDGLDSDTVLLVKMVRDADKLDIWHVLLQYYSKPAAERSATVGLDLPDSSNYSAAVLASVVRHEMVQMSTLTTLNDFKLLQLAWIFDLNFRRSFELVEERNYIDALAATLPRTGEIEHALNTVRMYVESRMRSR